MSQGKKITPQNRKGRLPGTWVWAQVSSGILTAREPTPTHAHAHDKKRLHVRTQPPNHKFQISYSVYAGIAHEAHNKLLWNGALLAFSDLYSTRAQIVMAESCEFARLGREEDGWKFALWLCVWFPDICQSQSSERQLWLNPPQDVIWLYDPSVRPQTIRVWEYIGGKITWLRSINLAEITRLRWPGWDRVKWSNMK